MGYHRCRGVEDTVSVGRLFTEAVEVEEEFVNDAEKGGVAIGMDNRDTEDTKGF